ncbi:FtsX-like permease family protein [Paenibacillus sp. FJAT-26967]|uniref:FtsX-like permease family protein n=1 Tax=Paenibacillus sp. FJAT-26967 TaxID=1729690 RepID=UPI0008385A80|nr:ABC transporter permease [Paenibacillus sp. FJAT-26967]
MTFRQFAFNNILRNKRTYIAHFLSSAFSVMIFFTYALLLFHPKLQGELASTSDTMSSLGTMGMKISQILIFIFSFFFLLYSVSAFLKNRKKEFGLLMVLGMSRRQLKKLVFMENMIIGIASMVAGIGTGLIFAKLILLISAKVLYLTRGLPFYIPLKAIGMTAGAFLVLFLLISLFTSGVGKSGRLVDLLKSEEKPKPEPKASVKLSFLALIFIVLGYAMVFLFAGKRIFSFSLLFGGVLFTILGTYFLFAQLSVYIIRALKKKENIFYRKTNLLTLSELSYRMKDNAIMFFMVSIVSSVAFTGIGTSMAIGDPGLASMQNPYAFTYATKLGDAREKKHVQLIETELSKAGFESETLSAVPKYSENGITIIPLSDYNKMASALGYQPQTLEEENQALVTPAGISQKNDYKKSPPSVDTIEYDKEGVVTGFQVKKVLTDLVFPYGAGVMIVVTDANYAKAVLDEYAQRYYVFQVPGWENSIEVANKINALIPLDRNGDYNYSALVSDWLSSKQKNGILLIVSVLVGIVFFTFAASFIYFRLYADLERDEKQYQMIAKVGLSRKELRTTVTRQLLLIFFLPLGMSLIHSIVAFIALQQLVDYSLFMSSLQIFLSFTAVQFIYFILIRWRYLQHMYSKIA